MTGLRTSLHSTFGTLHLVQTPGTKFDDAISPGNCTLHTVRRDKYSPVPFAQLPDELSNLFQAFSVEAGIRFIENHDRWIMQQRPRDRQPLSHSSTVCPH